MNCRLRRERVKRGLSMPEVAKEAGINLQNLKMVECGMLKPYPYMRKGLAEFYGVNEKILFKEIDEAHDYLLYLCGKRVRRVFTVIKQARAAGEEV